MKKKENFLNIDKYKKNRNLLQTSKKKISFNT